tara:strand:- start:5091 stop:6725 length:1635 start_codon:yes stop_codon:yes gene_type:complete
MIQKHPFHLVDPSPWPLLASISAFITTTGAVIFMHNFSGGKNFLFFGFFCLIFTIFVWWRDIIREGTFEGQHTSIVQLGLRFGIILFIVSEAMLFFAFFWAFFWASLAPVPEIGSVWPPKGIETLSAWEVPFLNTVILLSSGASVTWAHHAIIAGFRKEALISLSITVALAILFTCLQLFEYFSANFTIADGIYGSTFYIATGFHGFHVFIGTCFLTVCLYRIFVYHFTKQHHFGFEAAAWYWHFVDVVWLFLFVSIYWWGNLIMLFSPLEQFEIFPLLPFRVGSLDFSFTNSGFFLLFICITYIIFTKLVYAQGHGFYVPSRWQLVFENLYAFTADMVEENMGKKGQAFIPFIFGLFSFLLLANIFGMVPYSFTVTSHLIVTFTLSTIVWVGKLCIGVKHHGIKILGVLLPSGIPFVIVPFFVVVELLSFFIPLAALGIRLFANMIAGHILLKVIVGFCWSMLLAGNFFFLAHFIPMFILFLLLFLETAVAFIQAYVFTMLTCLITGDIVRGGHLVRYSLYFSSSSVVERLAVNQDAVGSNPI